MKKRYPVSLFRKLILLFIGLTLAGLTDTKAQSGACNNADFEEGSFNNWEGELGTCCPINTSPSAITPGRHTIMTGTGVDPWEGFPVVAPSGGVYSVRLGNEENGEEAEKLIYHFKVTPLNYAFTYQYAVVLQDPDHDPDDQPRFDIAVTDSTGALLPCGKYSVVSGAFIPGFNYDTKNSIAWKDWSVVSIDLSPYIGQTITITFATGDCALGAHFGYAYIDASCNPLQIDAGYCPGSKTAELVAPPGYQTYKWSTGDTTQHVVITNPVDGQTYSVTMYPYAGTSCPSQISFVLHVSSGFVANFTSLAGCSSGLMKFTDSTYAMPGGSKPTGWTWDFGDGSPPYSGQNPTHTYAAPGTYTITMYADNKGGCYDTITKQVVVPDGLKLTLPSTSQHNGVNLTCFNSNDGTASITPSGGAGGYKYRWNTSPIQTTQMAINLAQGTYIVTVTDSSGCSDTAHFLITRPPQLIVTTTNVMVGCSGNDGSITATVTGGITPYTYTWNTTPVKTTKSINSLAVGNYTVIVTDKNGCTATSNVNLVSVPLLKVDTVHTNVICNGAADGTITVTASSGIPPYTYTWSNGKTTSSLNNLAPGKYTVTVHNDNRCPDKVYTIEVVQPPALKLKFETTPAGCLIASDGKIKVTASGGVQPYLYLWSNGQNTADVDSMPAGDYFVTITDGHGCIITGSDSIRYLPDPVVDAGKDQVIDKYQSTGLQATVFPLGDYEFVWDPDKWLSDNKIPNPGATPLVTTTYIVTATLENGCTDDDTLVIYVVPLLVVPNVFSPNNDLHNDIFHILNAYDVYNLKFRMYNRWGQLIIETADPFFKWDGTFNGTDCEVGVYVWKATYKTLYTSEEKDAEGNVTLLR